MGVLVFFDDSIEFTSVTRTNDVDVNRPKIWVVEPHRPSADYDRSTMVAIITDE